MEYVDKILCISHTELTEGGILTKSNISILRRRGKIKQVRRACPGRTALFAVYSLPPKYIQKVFDKYLLPEDELFYSFSVLPDSASFRYYNSYLLPDGRHLPEQTIKELVTNAEILNAIGNLLKKANKINKERGAKIIRFGEVWRTFAAFLNTGAYPNTLPKNDRMLQAKYEEYVEKGYESLISGKWNNHNSIKVSTDEQINYLCNLLSPNNNYNNSVVCSKFNEYAKIKGWKPVSVGTVDFWRKKIEHKYFSSLYPLSDEDDLLTIKVLPECDSWRFYSSYLISDGRHLPEHLIIELSTNAELLNALGKILLRATIINKLHKQKIIKTLDFWKVAADYLKNEADTNTLPKNPRILQAKYNEYVAKGYVSLISGKWNNQNSTKIATDEQIKYISELLSIRYNYSDSIVCSKYNELAKNKGWKLISLSTVEIWRKKVKQNLYSSLSKIREESLTARDSLLTEEDLLDFQNDELTQPIKHSNLEDIVLKALLDGEDVETIIKQNHLMPSIVADNINERFYDQFADNIVGCDDKNIWLIDDYKNDIKL